MKWIPLNTALMSNPWNWVMFTLMFLVASYAFAILLPDDTTATTPNA